MPSDFTVLSKQRPQAEGGGLDPQPAGLDPRQVEDVVEQLQEGAGRFAGRVDVVADRGRKLFRERQVRHAQDRVHGRAQLVAHAGQELALGHVGRLRLGGPLLQRLHQADPLHGDRHLVGDGAGSVPSPLRKTPLAFREPKERVPITRPWFSSGRQA